MCVPKPAIEQPELEQKQRSLRTDDAEQKCDLEQLQATTKARISDCESKTQARLVEEIVGVEAIRIVRVGLPEQPNHHEEAAAAQSVQKRSVWQCPHSK